MNPLQIENILIRKIGPEGQTETNDYVAVEEPLEIQLSYSTVNGRMKKSIAVTMRTPGNDTELAVGFLFTEGIIMDKHDVEDIKMSAVDINRLLLTLKENVIPKLNKSDRNFYSTSSCGICGKASLEAIRTLAEYEFKKDTISVHEVILFRLQESIKQSQEVFENTGGIHASALFSLNGDLLIIKEDVGRHNALDKVIGDAFLKGQLPLSNCILFLSGRASFELIQKAAMAGIKIVAAVGAPSSLAVDLAKEMGMTLIGFLRNNRFNIYAGEQRIHI